MKGKITWLNGKKKVSDLKPFPGNPRKADEKQASELRSSLDRFNLADPLIINTDGTVIGGNFRLRLLTEKKIDSVDVRIPNRTLKYDTWLSIANEFQNPKGANVMIFEYWKNMVELWQAISKYWKIRNMIIWHLPNRHQGFAPRNQFFGKYDIAPLAGDGPVNEKYEIEFDKYLQEKGQKLIDTYDILMFGTHGKAEWSKKKGGKMWTMSDHVTWTASSETESGQNVVFGVKPVPILIPYIKTLSPRGGLVMEPFGGSGSCIIASEIMKRKCYAIELSETYAEVILNRFEKFSGIKAVKLENKA